MLTLRQQGMQQGLQQGRQEGLQEGRSEGQAQMLLRLLDRRFGPLSASVNERVGAASAVELERWADAILDARTLDEVFGTH